MKKILLFVLILGLANWFFSYQSRNADKNDTNQMYELTLIKNGVAR